MRTIVLLCAGTLAAVGCSKSGATGDQLSFHPALTLSWPGAPTESSQVLPTEGGDLKHYDATFAEKRPNGVVIFSASVQEYPEKEAGRLSSRQWLDAFVFASRKNETARKELDFGPQKYPAIETTTRSGKLFTRRLVVLAGARFYDIAVTASSETFLGDEEVKGFFDSFRVDE